MQYLLPTTWTAVKGLGVDLLHLSQLLSTNPAHLAGLGSKGRLAKGMDADIVVSGRAKVGSNLQGWFFVHDWITAEGAKCGAMKTRWR
jgi:alpha-D-ribose 1-methylphosphonate 5-triphosphate diphosphatase PhnM